MNSANPSQNDIDKVGPACAGLLLFLLLISVGVMRYILAPDLVEDYADPCNVTGVLSIEALRELQVKEAKVLTLISIAEKDTILRDAGIIEKSIIEFLNESMDILKDKLKKVSLDINEQISLRRPCAGENIRKNWNYLMAKAIGIPLCFLIPGLFILSCMIWSVKKCNGFAVCNGFLIILIGFTVTGLWLRDIIFLVDFNEKKLDFSYDPFYDLLFKS